MPLIDYQKAIAKCDVCGHEQIMVDHTFDVNSLFGGEHVKMTGSPPKGWVRVTVAGVLIKIICPKHSVKMRVDGQLFVRTQEGETTWYDVKTERRSDEDPQGKAQEEPD